MEKWGTKKMFYIGVDLGTSAVKLLLMDEKGNILNVVSKEYPLYFPNPGWSEQPPEAWYEKSVEELVNTQDTEEIETGSDIKITLVPGYPKDASVCHAECQAAWNETYITGNMTYEHRLSFVKRIPVPVSHLLT